MMLTPAAQLQQQIATMTGLSLDLLQQPNIAGFVRRRCQELGLDDDLAYHRLAIRDPVEMELMVKEVSVPETWFFRYPASFDLLIDHCSRLLGEGQQQLRMLSIACATGEEPYGMTMAALEAGWPIDRIAVDALDRNEASLSIARRGLYSDFSFRESMPSWAERWLRFVDGKRQVDTSVAARIQFKCDDILNCSRIAAVSNFDVVFCRNLYIYLSDPARTQLSRLLASLLSPSGLLFVGHAETAILANDSFCPAGVKHTFALRRIHSGHERTRQKQPVPIVKTPPLAFQKPPSPSPGQQHRQQHRQQHEHHSNPITSAPRTIDRSFDESETGQGLTLQDACEMADTGQLDQAMAILERIGPRHANGPEYFELLGNLNLSLGQIQAAREAFTKVLYLKSDHEVALLQLASIFDRLGHTEQSARLRRRAMDAHDREQRNSSDHEA